MSLEQAQLDMVAAFEIARLAWTGAAFDVQYPGRALLNLADQVNPFIGMDFDWLAGEQLEMNPVKNVRTRVNLILAIAVKTGEGTRVPAQLYDYFSRALQLRAIGAARVEAATAGRMREHLGWEYRPLILPFWLTSPAA